MFSAAQTFLRWEPLIWFHWWFALGMASTKRELGQCKRQHGNDKWIRNEKSHTSRGMKKKITKHMQHENIKIFYVRFGRSFRSWQEQHSYLKLWSYSSIWTCLPQHASQRTPGSRCGCPGWRWTRSWEATIVPTRKKIHPPVCTTLNVFARHICPGDCTAITRVWACASNPQLWLAGPATTCWWRWTTMTNIHL